ncbi:hypothetical protein CHS0354_015000 [Potamilus streckersoni]|uniref:Coiled-coil domain-containing protein 84 n=1 Tax=Potamilus streckersoni TaxID=2493646 RepID=A0AAE0SME6_9BIVA|nr:hypothetical protein CHS0354_015000 [Potamilus streckersoni]
MAETTSFVQFEYCPLCKTSHKKKKKHLYSKRHKEILQNILRKFENKIQTAKATLFNPEIQPLEFEKGAKFWCYFCAKEVEKHTQEDFCVIQYGGLLCHIASDEHLGKLLQFFWDNIVERSLKSKYILMANELEIFKKTSFLAVKKYEKSLEILRKQMAEKIHSVEQKRRQHINQSIWEKSMTSLTRHNVQMLPPKSSSTKQKPVGKRTISAYGKGLTWIQYKCFDEDKGNIFTEATPPWLCVDEEDGDKQTEIGPTVQDYQKYLQREKKKRLPSTRVGAKFDHNAETSAQWLPSFGGVWNQGRRLQSKQYFGRQIKKSRQLGIADGGQKAAINKLNLQPWTGQMGDCLTGQSDTTFTGSSFSFQASSSGENLIFMTQPAVKPYRRKRTWTQSEQTQSAWLTNNFNYEMNTEANLNSVENTMTQNSDVSLYHSERIRSVSDQSHAFQTDSDKNGTRCSADKWNFIAPTSVRLDNCNGNYSKPFFEGHMQGSYHMPVSNIQSYQSKRKKHLVTGSNPSGYLINQNTVADVYFAEQGHEENGADIKRSMFMGRMHSVSLIDTPVLKR